MGDRCQRQPSMSPKWGMCDLKIYRHVVPSLIAASDMPGAHHRPLRLGAFGNKSLKEAHNGYSKLVSRMRYFEPLLLGRRGSWRKERSGK